MGIQKTKRWKRKEIIIRLEVDQEKNNYLIYQRIISIYLVHLFYLFNHINIETELANNPNIRKRMERRGGKGCLKTAFLLFSFII